MPEKPIATEPPRLDPGHFRRVCGRFASGVTIVTAVDRNGAQRGMTASSFTSVSLSPPLILVCVGHATQIVHVFREAKYFGVNVLNESQRALSEQFAGSGDRFEGIPWRAGRTGVPLFPDVLATLECARVDCATQGDHDIVIGEVLHADFREGEPLIHYGSQYRGLEASLGWWSTL